MDRRYSSGLDAIFLAVMKVQTDNADIVVAGGMDSMSQAELYVQGELKWGLGGKRDEKWGFMPRGILVIVVGSVHGYTSQLASLGPADGPTPCRETRVSL